jgi:hypothetical protein
MALYVSKARRARRTTIVCVLVAIVAGGLGWAIGHGQVPSVDERVQSVRSDADRIATDISRLDIEYQQALAGQGDSVTAGVLTPLRDEQTALQHTMDRAPWLAAARRSEMLDSVVAAEQAARDHVTLEEFRARLTTSAKLIRASLVT